VGDGDDRNDEEQRQGPHDEQVIQAQARERPIPGKKHASYRNYHQQGDRWRKDDQGQTRMDGCRRATWTRPSRD
jgi:hypothetical protein